MAKCSLCEKTLIEFGRDIHNLSKSYDLPFEIEWKGEDCCITNKIVTSICSECLGKVMKTVKECMKKEEVNEERIEEYESIWF